MTIEATNPMTMIANLTIIIKTIDGMIVVNPTTRTLEEQVLQQEG
jgi:hypothetical protein